MNDSYLPNCTEPRKRELGSSPLLGLSGCGAMGMLLETRAAGLEVELKLDQLLFNCWITENPKGTINSASLKIGTQRVYLMNRGQGKKINYKHMV